VFAAPTGPLVGDALSILAIGTDIQYDVGIMSTESVTRYPLGVRVKAWREELTLTQTELAVRAGVALSTITRLEQHPDSPVRATTRKKLARALRVPLEELVG
jgi:DNA-binding XRE family transcriptional regulator